MKNGIIAPSLLALGVIFIAALVYFLSSGSYLKKSESLSSESQDTFQEILSKNCKRYSSDNVSEEIEIKNLPFKINTNVVSVNYSPDKTGPSAYPIVCYGGQDLNSRSLAINNTSGFEISVFDHRSYDQPNRPYLQSDIIVVDERRSNIDSDKNKKTIWMYLIAPEGGYTSERSIEDIVLLIRGEKWIELKNGQPYYISIARVAIDKEDPRLLNILKGFSHQSKSNLGAVITNDSLQTPQKKIRDDLFSNMNNLKEPEKKNIRLVNEALDAFTAK